MLRAYFDEREQVALTLLIVAINGWNRFAVGFRSEPQPQPGDLAAR